ncbi:hypothetical protein EV421DRAFT_1466123 [Armillaria borealis]|uniref:Uncharacterized protein n=1 Tax=Armillaria borealis TaxID=47425 RepID=A0AA39JTK8_9AGAR|nr:hypothetical protein EV421DRAFT_1466123 [Armillaria borealis]
MSLHASLLLHYWPYPSNHGPEERPLAAGSVFPDEPYRWSQMQCSDCVHPTTTAGMQPIVNNDVFAISRSLFERLYSQQPQAPPFYCRPSYSCTLTLVAIVIESAGKYKAPWDTFSPCSVRLVLVRQRHRRHTQPTLRSSRRCMMEHFARLSCLCTRPLIMTAFCSSDHIIAVPPCFQRALRSLLGHEASDVFPYCSGEVAIPWKQRSIVPGSRYAREEDMRYRNWD